MTSEEINDFIRNNHTLSYHELSLKTGISDDAVRHRYRTMGLPIKQIQDRHIVKKKSVKDFLQTAKTERQLIDEFGTEWRAQAEKEPNFYIFEQRNRFNELIYLLVPEMKTGITLQKKKWHYTIGKDEQGKEQPYVVAQLPKFKEDLRITPLFDVHYGHYSHRKEKFLSYVEWIRSNDNVYTILGGDLIENAVDDGRGMTYDQAVPPMQQVNDIAELLAPIAHKILVAIPGNHEERTYKKTGIDVMKMLADKLDIPYFSGPVFLTVLANTYKWNFYIHHGRGNAQTKGGQINMANKPKVFVTNVQFLVSGHVHNLFVEPETYITDDPINHRLIEVTQWTVGCPSFLAFWDTYAYRAEYRPPAKGGVSMVLYENGEYKAELTVS